MQKGEFFNKSKRRIYGLGFIHKARRHVICKLVFVASHKVNVIILSTML